jgi:tRNA-2-methylthio-N6-dimethylallyladenosine synthase
VLNTDFPAQVKFDHLPEVMLGSEAIDNASAFLTVQEGCDKFCSFCVVPYTRGTEASRPVEQIRDEAVNLIKGGAKELVLLGQNVNAYHGLSKSGKEWSLSRLIRELAEIDGLARIRYTTSHPKDMDHGLIIAHAEVPQLMPYLHLPIQTGSDRMLKAMNRKHNVAFYLNIIEELRAARPDIALSSDFIVGHPGETDSDFADTIRLITKIGYSQAYSFKYSPRPGTPASNLEQISDAAKSDRLQTLQQLLNEQQLAFNMQSINTTQKVLVERQRNRDGRLTGRSPFMQTVSFDGPIRLLGEVIDISVEQATEKSLFGKALIEEQYSAHTVMNKDYSEGRKHA